MAKIVQFPSKEREIVQLLEEITEAAKNGAFKSFAFVAVGNGDDFVYTTYCNADVADKQYLASHIQVDVMNEIVRVNYFDE